MASVHVWVANKEEQLQYECNFVGPTYVCDSVLSHLKEKVKPYKIYAELRDDDNSLLRIHDKDIIEYDGQVK